MNIEPLPFAGLSEEMKQIDSYLQKCNDGQAIIGKHICRVYPLEPFIFATEELRQEMLDEKSI